MSEEKDTAKELRELRADLKESESLRTGLLTQRNELKAKLDWSCHELRHAEQAVRSLHWALGQALREVRRYQVEREEFGGETREWVKSSE